MSDFKKELAAFAEDIREMCQNTSCSNCRLRSNGYCGGTPIGSFFYADAALAAVEEYRSSKKPRVEERDKALDVYRIEVVVERSGRLGLAYSASDHAKLLQGSIEGFYARGHSDRKSAVVRVLSTKRFALESHKEVEE